MMGRKSPIDPHFPQILQRIESGEPTYLIADDLGLTRASLQAYLKRRGISNPAGRMHAKRLDDAELRRLIEDERLTQWQTAEALDVSRSAVGRRCESLQLKTARTGPRHSDGHPCWKGGRRVDKHGYVEVFAPLHPLAKAPSGYVFEHRLVMEVVLGRYLSSLEVVDHRDNHPRHNSPDNLRFYATNADHLRSTLTGREKATPRRSILGAYGSNQKIGRCPGQLETLAQCPQDVRQQVERHILIHQLLPEDYLQSRKALLRRGPGQTPFQ
jgi:hypothetical protein